MEQATISQADIERIRQTLLPELAEMIEKAFEKQDKRLTALFDKDFGHMKETLDQHRNWHDDHFKKDDKLLEKQTFNKEVLEKQITDSRISTIQEISRENEKQDETISRLSDRVTIIESEARGKHSLIALVIAIIGAIGAIGAVIMAAPA